MNTPKPTVLENANKLRDLVLKRIGVKPSELKCPRENSDMTPCVARDGELAVCELYGEPRPEPMIAALKKAAAQYVQIEAAKTAGNTKKKT